jgi:uncharacterized protein
MSGSQTQSGGAQPGSGGADPSMEDILASIRRILSEEDVPAPAASPITEQSSEQQQDVLLLDSSMLVAEVPQQRPAIRARAVPPPPPPVLVPPAEEPPEPEPIAAKHEEVAQVDVSPSGSGSPEPSPPEVSPPEFTAPEARLAEPVEPEPTPPEVIAPEPTPAEPAKLEATPPAAEPGSILAEITSEHLMASNEIGAAVAHAMAIERPVTETAAANHGDVPEFGPARMEAPMPAEAIPPLTPASGLQASPILVPVPRVGQPIVERPAAVPVEPPFIHPPASPTAYQSTSPDSGLIASTSTTPLSESSVMSASMSASGLASAETANAAAGSVTNLVRALTSDRSSQVFGGGPTIADLVREELRPMLKAWLDSNLPPLVERLVRAEIERVISRATV